MRRTGRQADAPAAGSRTAGPARRLARIALGAAAAAVAGLALASTLSGVAMQTSQAAGPDPGADGSFPAQPAEGRAAGAWEEVADVRPRFALAGSEYGREPDFFSVRRNVAGGGRLDQIAFGSPHEPGPYLRFTFYRPFDEPVGGVSFWLEMARRAGEAGLALERSQPVPELAQTRFGAFEIGILRASGPQGPRACLGFRHEGHEPDFVISGVACLNAEPALARQALVCAIEAVTLAPGQDDAELAQFFERAGARTCERPPPGPTARLDRQGRR
ncbi:MAG: hypothetical protein K2Y29_20185 [Beijerinckiaceae bacterium]|nr:hypothetical protein [Beijerinckiaceae bacterium]